MGKIIDLLPGEIQVIDIDTTALDLTFMRLVHDKKRRQAIINQQKRKRKY